MQGLARWTCFSAGRAMRSSRRSIRRLARSKETTNHYHNPPMQKMKAMMLATAMRCRCFRERDEAAAVAGRRPRRSRWTFKLRAPVEVRWASSWRATYLQGLQRSKRMEQSRQSSATALALCDCGSLACGSCRAMSVLTSTTARAPRARHYGGPAPRWPSMALLSPRRDMGAAWPMAVRPLRGASGAVRRPRRRMQQATTPTEQRVRRTARPRRTPGGLRRRPRGQNGCSGRSTNAGERKRRAHEKPSRQCVLLTVCAYTSPITLDIARRVHSARNGHRVTDS
mmetsp:Transcript_8174/g.25189  ORF Transcript_8174/g.25189 Transcript_8174/m.25189 type:complete len:283 (-) Transcript_8174:1013-1861(-)